MNKSILIILIIVIAIFSFSLGIYLGKYLTSAGTYQNLMTVSDDQSAWLQTIEKKINDAGLVRPEMRNPPSDNTFSGTIKSVNDKNLILIKTLDNLHDVLWETNPEYVINFDSATSLHSLDNIALTPADLKPGESIRLKYLEAPNGKHELTATEIIINRTINPAAPPINNPTNNSRPSLFN